jgi:methylmalonyl-CoA/ethylmalonyl-CoA epimerase
MLSRVHHVGLVVRRLEDGFALWRDRFGLEVAKQATVADQGVRAALLPIGNSEIELLEPIGSDSGVARFLAKRGEGLHHICLQSDDVAADLAAARTRGLPLIDERPRPGLAGQICFLHPKGTRGALVEFAQPPTGEHHHAPARSGPLADLSLHEVTIQTRDAASAADLFADAFALPRAAADGPPGLTATAVRAGAVRLVFLAAEAGAASAEAAAFRSRVESAGEGLLGLVLTVRAIAAAAAALEALAPVEVASQSFTLLPARCHGVPLDVRAI